MIESSDGLAAAFWQDVQAQLSKDIESRAEVETMVRMYMRRLAGFSDLELVYHQGVEETVQAIKRGGYVTDPSSPPRPLSNQEVLLGYLKGRA